MQPYPVIDVWRLDESAITATLAAVQRPGRDGKACWGQPLKSSNLLSSATLTSADESDPRTLRPALLLPKLVSVLVSVGGGIGLLVTVG
jgi:hypothetical protein